MADVRAHICHGLTDVQPAPSVVSIGFFDGVHRGHQSIIHHAARRAGDEGVRSVVVTFDRHPMEVVKPGSQPPLLMTLQRRTTTLAELGVDLVVVLPFDDDLRHSKPAAFVDRVLTGPLQATAVIVGANFRFGHRAQGDVAGLTDLGAARGFSTLGVTLLEIDGITVSSTQIRAAVGDGDVQQAATLLGRPYSLDGIVVRGEQRGATLGFPTANLAVSERSAVPHLGVYAGRFHSGQTSADCVTNVGQRPTFHGTDTRIEAHLLDMDVDLYGSSASVEFLHHLRDEQRFESPDDLMVQIARDIDRTRTLMSTR